MKGIFISPIAGTIPFDNSNNGFVSDNLQSAVEEARNTSASQEQFSHNGVDNDLIIPFKRQMLVYQEIEIELNKTLDILGELVLIE